MSERVPSLMDEYPLLVYPSLAVAMGVNKALVFQQLHFLLCNQKTAKNEYVLIGGRWWVYNSYPEWQASYFPWLSISALKGFFIALERETLILTMQSVKNKSDRRKWYTIDYLAFDQYKLTMGQKMSNGSLDKKDPMMGQKVSNGYSETSTETSTETSKIHSDALASGRETKPREPNPIFDAVIRGHKMDAQNTQGGRVAMIANWLAGSYEGKGVRKVGFISSPATVAHIDQFFKDWAKDNKINPPLDFVKFVEHWRKWAASKSGSAQPQSKYFKPSGG